MLSRYVVADLVRNPRRTLSTMVGVILGVGLFCGVLFFVDGLSASMTQRAVAPLSIDMQRIVTQRVGGTLALTQAFDSTTLTRGSQATVSLEVHNTSDVAANEVTIRSLPAPGLRFVADTAEIDGHLLGGFDDNPFAHGAGPIGFNLGTLGPGAVHRIKYVVSAETDTALSDAVIASTYSSRESVSPLPANRRLTVPLDELDELVSAVPGVAHSSQLSFADLGPNTLSTTGSSASGPAKIFGFDADYADGDPTVRIVEGELSATGGVISAEAATALGVGLGDNVTVRLPDSSTLEVPVSGIADLSQSQSLFSSRRGGDLETFVYSRNSLVVSPRMFNETVLPAYELAATQRGARLKSPPVREVDIKLDRSILAADPATALQQTQRISAAINDVATHQDYLLDNISNTLNVASSDAAVAKRLFVFLGVPGGLLAAMLAAYAGTVLAEGQRREQATLRIRGASRRHLLRMLMLRTGLLTSVGSAVGLCIGYLTTVAVLGQDSLGQASLASLVASALIGTVGGFLATGTALYVTGRRSIDREIHQDRAQLNSRPPLWRRARLDIVGLVVIALGTAAALRNHAFDGAPGSVYFGRSVKLNLALLGLPIAVWMTGSLLSGRVCSNLLALSRPGSTLDVGRPLPSLFRFSVTRRPWAIANGAVVVSLIVAVAISLAAFTASYDAAKTNDSRYATGSDIRITPSPTSERGYGVDAAADFRTDGIAETTPVIYGISNVILRSDRTSDPANLAAIDPTSYESVSPVDSSQFPSGDASGTLGKLATDPEAVLLSEDMATFLKAEVGDRLFVLLARSTNKQVEVELHVTGLYERLPGFPDGADAVMGLDQYIAAVPSKMPDFFLAATASQDDEGLQRGLTSLQGLSATADDLHIQTRATTLAKDQSSLAALNISGLVRLDQTFALSMAAVAIAIFVFGLLLSRRREYITLRAQGLESRTIRLLIAGEAGTVALAGAVGGLIVGSVMGYYFITALRPLFVLDPGYTLTLGAVLTPIVLVFGATLVSSFAASRLVSGLEPTELLRDE